MVPAFYCDAMLGKLATLLRTIGIDASYSRSIEPHELLLRSDSDNRIVLTRRTALPAAGSGPQQYRVISNDPTQQLTEVLNHFHIEPARLPHFSRCLRCNQILHKTGREQAAGRVPEYVFNTVENFSHCPSCGRIYWQGTHCRNMRRRMACLGIELDR